MDQVTEIAVRPEGVGVLAVVNLDGVRAQWGGGAWTMIEDHLVRVLLSTMGKQSKMIVRANVQDGARQLLLNFQYQNLRRDFAQIFFDVFADFQSGPVCIGLSEIRPGMPGLFAALKGVPYVLVKEVGGHPVIPQLAIDDDDVKWVGVGAPGESPVPFSLRTAVDMGDGLLGVQTERTVPIELGQLVEGP